MISVALALALVGSWFFASNIWARLLLAVARRWAGLNSRYVTVGDTRWHYLEGGHGPLLVALHGFGGDADNWLRAAPHLKKHFRVLFPDLPGFGDSSPGRDARYEIPAQARRLRAFLEAVGEQPEFLAGNSMGGWVACDYAMNYPHQLQALWLLAPLGVKDAPPSPVLKAIESGDASPLDISSADQFRRRVVQPMFGRVPVIPTPMMAYYARRGIANSECAQVQFSQVLASPLSLEHIMVKLSLPVQLQWGTLDRAVNPEGAKALRSVKPDIEIHMLEAIGHLPMLESPRDSVERWVAFCRQRGLLGH